MKKIIDKLSSPRRSTRDLSLGILVTLGLAALFSAINPNFITKYNLISIGQSLAPYAMLALGVLMPISTGGTDLSVGAVCIGSAVVAGKLYSMGMPLVLVIPVMILFGSLIGLLNGYLIAKKKLQPFIATLGTMMFVRGITAIFANAATILYPTGSWYNSLFSTYNGWPVSFAWILLFAGILYFVYRRTKLGRYFVSIGSNERATRLSGVDVDKYLILAYTLSGLMAGIAGIFWSASFATITVATGNGMELDAIASVYIGGTSAVGGLANVFGSVLGAIMLVIIRSGLNFSLAKLNIPINSTYITYVISGIIVVVAVLAERSKIDGSRRRKALTPRKQAYVRLVCGIISLAIFAGLVVQGIFTSNNDVTAPDESKTICILMRSEGNDFWDTVSAGAQAAGEEFGYTVICRGPEGEDASYLPKQREFISTMLSLNPTGLGIAAIADGLSDLIIEAYERNLPVVQCDAGIYSEDMKTINELNSNPLRSSVIASSYDNAGIVATHAFEAVRDDIISSDTYVVGIIQHGVYEDAENRALGFADKFKELSENDPETAGKCQVIIEVKPSEMNNAYKEGLEFLFEKGAKLVFATNMTSVDQCADAVQSAGGKYDGVSFVGYDTGDKIKEWIKSDSKSPLIGTVSQNPYMIGYTTAKALIDLSEGRECDEKLYVPGEWVDINNVDSV